MNLKRVLHYLNPMEHLGEKTYSAKFPLVIGIVVYLLMDLVSYAIHQANNIGNVIIFITFALIIYFSFRTAIKGGLTIWFVAILYFIYFIYSRQASLSLKETASFITAILAITYLLIVFIIGWLKQTLDGLLAREKEARMRAEREQHQFQTILEQLPVGVAVAAAPKGKVIQTNEKLREIFQNDARHIASVKDYGRTPAYKRGKKLKPEDWPLAKAVLHGKSVIGEEISFSNKKNKKMVLQVNAAPLHDENNKIIGAVSTFFDITDQKNIEQQKDDLIASASHELKTPLTSISVFAQLLERRFKKLNDTKSEEILNKLNFQLKGLTDLVQELLDTSKLGKGSLELHKQVFYVKDLMRELLEPLQQISEHRIVLDTQAKIPVYADKERIRQVLINLVTNAMKYSPKTKDIIVGTHPNTQGHIVVSVQDFGIGIPGENKDHVFERFFRSDTHKTFPGLGLGLYISSEIIKQHKGKIWVESEEGKGSTFYFSLPAAKEKDK